MIRFNKNSDVYGHLYFQIARGAMKIFGGWYDRSIGDYQRHSARSSGRRSVINTEQTAFPTSSTLCHSDMSTVVLGTK
jgi:hypothetical protein